MSLYALGDLHLHFQAPLKAKAQQADRLWRGHEEKFRNNCARTLAEEDTLVLLGDHSWGRTLEECAEDLAYIAALPGKKVLLRGNHDMFWDAAKTEALNERFHGELFFLQNNYYPYSDVALVGTKGFTFEGPFYLNNRGRIVGWDEKAADHAKKLIDRECTRLRASFESGRIGIGVLSCCCTIRPPAFSKTAAPLPPWRRNTAPSRSCTPTATGRAAFMTVCWASTTA